MDNLFLSIFEQSGTVSISLFLMTMLVSLALGFGFARIHMSEGNYSKGFVVSLALLPTAVSLIIMMVNGNIGTGLAIAGAFSLVRFRSVPGTAREIASVLLVMTVGLALGMGYIGYAVLFSIIVGAVQWWLYQTSFGEPPVNPHNRIVRITVPENLNYTAAFDEVFKAYTNLVQLKSVKTTNMGSMFRLTYFIELNDVSVEKVMIDALRVRNGNLEISSSLPELKIQEL